MGATEVFRWYRMVAAQMGLWMGFRYTEQERPLLEIAKHLVYPK